MFCSGCGKKLEENADFCLECGKVVNREEEKVKAPESGEIATETILDENKMIKNKKAIAVIAIAIVAVAIFMFTRGGLSGTWAYSNHEYESTIKFSGNRFTVTEHYVWHDSQWPFTAGWGIRQGASFLHSPRRFNFERDFRITSQREQGHIQYGGTYSISGDRIEFRFSNDDIEVFTFSRTDNTLELWKTSRAFGTIRLIRR